MGEEFQLHTLYAVILRVVFVATFFGGILPIVYPVSLLSITAIYLTERYKVFYYYRQPPQMGSGSIFFALSYLAYFPLWGLFFSFWSVSNYQLWNEDIVAPSQSSDVMITDHGFDIFAQYSTYTGVAAMYIYFFGFNVIVIPMKTMYVGLKNFLTTG
jgi:hypothetical protein